MPENPRSFSACGRIARGDPFDGRFIDDERLVNAVPSSGRHAFVNAARAASLAGAPIDSATSMVKKSQLSMKPSTFFKLI